MNLIAKLFSKTPSATDIRLHLKEIEREQAKQRRRLDGLTQTKQAKVNQAVECKRAGKQEQVLEHFREIRQIEIDIGYANSDLRRISLSKTALTSFLRKVQMLEKKKDRKSLQNLASRFQDKSFLRAIDAAEVDDDTFNEMLQGILGEAEDSVVESKAVEDQGFAEFDGAISRMAEAEESGAAEDLPMQQTGYAQGKAGRAERFSLINDAGLKAQKPMARDDSQDQAGICLCSHGADECYHNGRAKSAARQIAEDQAGICLCSHGADECYHNGRAKSAARQIAEDQAGICLCSHGADECYHNGRAKSAARQIAENQDGICLCSHGADECYHNGRATPAARQIAENQDGICLCSHGADECYHNGRATSAARQIAENQDGICLCSHGADECYHNGRATSAARQIAENQDGICLCSHGADECYHNGRSKAAT